MRTTAMWVLLGVLVLLGVQPSEAGTGETPERKQDKADARAFDRYVALGDSYTAGTGIPPGQEAGCLRSERNYPSRLAERLGARLRDASCGSAQLVNAEAVQHTSSGPHPPQLRDVDRRTDLVTIGLGINDAWFGLLLMKCWEVAASDPLGTPCREHFRTADGGDSVMDSIPAVGRGMGRLIRLVQKRGPNAEVVVVGYPQLVPETGTCSGLPFALGDYGYVRQYMVEVNAVLKAAARRAGVHFADVLAASEGHDVCAGDDAWVLGAELSPRTAGFHPFANEQRAVAALVADLLR